jgi:protein-disulfide isomerase
VNLLGNGTAKRALDLVATIVLIAAGCAVLVANWPRLFPKTGRELSIPKVPIDVLGSAKIGSSDAPVALVSFSEFECPFCAKFANTVLPQLKREYIDPRRVLFVFRHFPLAIHPFARAAADLASCAASLGRFEATHDMLFAEQRDLSTLIALPSRLPLTPEEYSICRRSGVDSQVAKDISDGKALGVSGTPSFFVGRIDPSGRVWSTGSLRGAAPWAQFKELIDEALTSGRSGR